MATTNVCIGRNSKQCAAMRRCSYTKGKKRKYCRKISNKKKRKIHNLNSKKRSLYKKLSIR